MWLASLRRFVSGNFRSSSLNHGRSRPSRRPLTLDYLEDRIVLSTYTPTLLTDGVTGNPNGTLRDAILAANADTGTATDTIQLAAGTYTLSIANSSGHESNGTQGDLNITSTSHTLVIQGATNPDGTPATIIDQTQLDRVFQIVNPGTTVLFKNVILEGGIAQEDGAGGSTARGGGLLNNGGNVTLSNAIIQSNQAVGGPGQSAQGGGIYSSGGSLTLTNDILRNNSATGGNASQAGQNGGNAQGGGIFADGTTLMLSGSTIAPNNANAGAGGGGAAGTAQHPTGGTGGQGGLAQGGGVYVRNGSLTLSGGSSIADNTLNAAGNNVLGGAGAAGYDSGAIHGAGGTGGKGGDAAGGGVYASQSTLLIEGGSAIRSNTVNSGFGNNGGQGGQGMQGGTGGDAGLAQGGGVFATGKQVTVQGSGTAIYANSVNGGGGGQGGASGAAANTTDPAGVTGRTGGAGGEADGGGVSAINAPVIVNQGALIHDNTVTGGAGGNGGNGGAAAASGQQGGRGGVGGVGGAAQGGGLFSSGTSSITVALGDSSTAAGINNNMAIGGNGGSGGAGGTGGSSSAGGTGGAGGAATGGGVTVLGDNLTLKNASVLSNTLTGGRGGVGGSGANGGLGGNGGNGGNGQGGGLFVSGSSNALILNSSFVNNFVNQANGGATGLGATGGHFGRGSTNQGGGLYAASSTLTVVNSTLADNAVVAGTAGTNGPAASGGGDAQGGGLFATGGALTLLNDTITWNFLYAFTDAGAAAGAGGGVYNAASSSTLENTIIAINEVFNQATNASTVSAYSNLLGSPTSTDANLILSDGSDAALKPGGSTPLFAAGLTTNTFGTSGFTAQGQVPAIEGSQLTPTLPLAWTSPALTKGDPTLAANIAGYEGVSSTDATDQRGLKRVIDGAIDIGATQSQLVLTGSGAPATIQAGQTITYTFTVTNNESSAVNGPNPVSFTLSNVIPTNTAYKSSSGTGWSITAPSLGNNNTLTATVALSAGQSATLTLTVEVLPGTAANTIISDTATIAPSSNLTAVRGVTQNTTVSGSTTTDITSKVSILRSPILPDPFSGPNAFLQAVMLINNSGAVLNGPIALVLTGLPAGVTLTNATGTYNGSPYIDIVPANGSWQPGWLHFLIPILQFSNPNHVKITYTPQIVQGI